MLASLGADINPLPLCARAKIAVTLRRRRPRRRPRRCPRCTANTAPRKEVIGLCQRQD